MLREKLNNLLWDAIDQLWPSNDHLLAAISHGEMVIEPPQKLEYGDYVSAICLKISAFVNESPLDAARRMVNQFETMPYKMDVQFSCRAPGFVNVVIGTGMLCASARTLFQHHNVDFHGWLPENNADNFEFRYALLACCRLIRQFLEPRMSTVDGTEYPAYIDRHQWTALSDSLQDSELMFLPSVSTLTGKLIVLEADRLSEHLRKQENPWQNSIATLARLINDYVCEISSDRAEHPFLPGCVYNPDSQQGRQDAARVGLLLAVGGVFQDALRRVGSFGE